MGLAGVGAGAGLAIGGPIGGAIGGLAGGVADMIGASSANAQNNQMQKDQFTFERDMSNTAYQRATQDMSKAGINPMLAYMQGGASTPGGAGGGGMVSPTSGVDDPNLQGKEKAAADAKLQELSTKSQIDNIQADTTQKQATAKAAIINAASSAKQADKANTNEWYNTIKQISSDMFSPGSVKQNAVKQDQTGQSPSSAKGQY